MVRVNKTKPQNQVIKNKQKVNNKETYNAVKKYLPPFLIFYMFRTMKQILILDHDNPSKYKMHFFSDYFIY